MPVEAANMLRRAELAGEISADVAGLAYADLLDLPVSLFAFEPFADRVWQLRPNIAAYDAWYVALAEAFDTNLVTLDRRLAAADGPTCGFDTPP
jgi:predicted nucleic acid-binding protein